MRWWSPITTYPVLNSLTKYGFLPLFVSSIRSQTIQFHIVFPSLEIIISFHCLLSQEHQALSVFTVVAVYASADAVNSELTLMSPECCQISCPKVPAGSISLDPYCRRRLHTSLLGASFQKFFPSPVPGRTDIGSTRWL